MRGIWFGCIFVLALTAAHAAGTQEAPRADAVLAVHLLAAQTGEAEVATLTDLILAHSADNAAYLFIYDLNSNSRVFPHGRNAARDMNRWNAADASERGTLLGRALGRHDWTSQPGDAHALTNAKAWLRDHASVLIDKDLVQDVEVVLWLGSGFGVIKGGDWVNNTINIKCYKDGHAAALPHPLDFGSANVFPWIRHVDANDGDAALPGESEFALYYLMGVKNLMEAQNAGRLQGQLSSICTVGSQVASLDIANIQDVYSHDESCRGPIETVNRMILEQCGLLQGLIQSGLNSDWSHGGTSGPDFGNNTSVQLPEPRVNSTPQAETQPRPEPELAPRVQIDLSERSFAASHMRVIIPRRSAPVGALALAAGTARDVLALPVPLSAPLSTRATISNQAAATPGQPLAATDLPQGTAAVDVLVPRAALCDAAGSLALILAAPLSAAPVEVRLSVTPPNCAFGTEGDLVLRVPLP